MKVRFYINVIPLKPEKIPEGALPDSFPDFFKQMMAFRPGKPIIKTKIVEFPDDIPLKLHSGLLIQVTENHQFQVSMLKWDGRETEGPQIKVIFSGNIDMQNLSSLLRDMKEEGGWQDGCSCRFCQDKDNFSDMMRAMMGADPENN